MLLFVVPKIDHGETHSKYNHESHKRVHRHHQHQQNAYDQGAQETNSEEQQAESILVLDLFPEWLNMFIDFFYHSIENAVQHLAFEEGRLSVHMRVQLEFGVEFSELDHKVGLPVLVKVVLIRWNKQIGGVLEVLSTLMHFGRLPLSILLVMRFDFLWLILPVLGQRIRSKVEHNLAEPYLPIGLAELLADGCDQALKQVTSNLALDTDQVMNVELSNVNVVLLFQRL